MLGSLLRSHSQTVARTGWPKMRKKYDGMRLSQIMAIRAKRAAAEDNSRAAVRPRHVSYCSLFGPNERLLSSMKNWAFPYVKV